VERAGHIAGRVDGGVRGAQRRVRHHPVAHVETCRLGQSGVGDRADTGDHRVGAKDGAIGEPCAAGSPAGSGDPGHLDPEPEVDPVLAVQAGEHGRDLRAENVQQRQFRRLQDRHVYARSAGGGRDLQADPPGTDDQHPGRPREGVPDPVAVRRLAQVQDTVGVRARQAQAARGGPGGEQQLVVPETVTAGQRHLAAVAVDRGDGSAEP
jgi:hypothetical protein